MTRLMAGAAMLALVGCGEASGAGAACTADNSFADNFKIVGEVFNRPESQGFDPGAILEITDKMLTCVRHMKREADTDKEWEIMVFLIRTVQTLHERVELLRQAGIEQRDS